MGKNGRKRLLARFLPLPLPPLSFFGTRFISRAAKTENPVPLSFFTLKPNGNVFHVYIIFSYLICNLVPRVLSYPPYGERDIKKKTHFHKKGFALCLVFYIIVVQGRSRITGKQKIKGFLLRLT